MSLCCRCATVQGWGGEQPEGMREGRCCSALSVWVLKEAGFGFRVGYCFSSSDELPFSSEVLFTHFAFSVGRRWNGRIMV